MALPTKWKGFVENFDETLFWYFPHWLVDKPELADILAVFAHFDNKVWQDRAVLRKLQSETLTAGTGAGPRMMRKAMENLGLCWLDDHVLRITPAGRALLDGADKSSLLERLLWRYRLRNPVNDTPPIKLFPHAALIRILLQIGGRVSRDEYLLFVGRAADDDVKSVVEQIRLWRILPIKAQNEIISAIGSRFRSLQTVGGYSMGFHRCASYLRAIKDQRGRQGLELNPERRADAEAMLAKHDATTVAIDFATKAEWIAAHGDAERSSDLEDALDHYLDTSQPEKAVEAFARLPAAARRGRTVEEFHAEVFLEKHLEDYLVDHLDLIEPGLRLVKRQRGVLVGTIDILARAVDGAFVVIELKKVRASDKVFGQLCRYMGCVARHHAVKGQKVRGYIVGSEIDDKLRYAALVVGEPRIRLKRFRRDAASPDIFVED